MTRYVCPGNIDDWLQIVTSEGESSSYDDIVSENADHRRFAITISEYYDSSGEVVDTYSDDSDMECTYCGRSVRDLDLETAHDAIFSRQAALGYSLDALCIYNEAVYPTPEAHYEECDRHALEPETPPRQRQARPDDRPQTSLHAQWSAILLSEALAR